mmetsp:Transcript_2347/g.6486  ORF Transcript_2347/g.6486 Transcript_2347/m.6486 type:complete len:252 (-) Transcript_2347:201-956(-)
MVSYSYSACGRRRSPRKTAALASSFHASHSVSVLPCPPCEPFHSIFHHLATQLFQDLVDALDAHRQFLFQRLHILGVHIGDRIAIAIVILLPYPFQVVCRRVLQLLLFLLLQLLHEFGQIVALVLLLQDGLNTLHGIAQHSEDGRDLGDSLWVLGEVAGLEDGFQTAFVLLVGRHAILLHLLDGLEQLHDAHAFQFLLDLALPLLRLLLLKLCCFLFGIFLVFVANHVDDLSHGLDVVGHVGALAAAGSWL